MGEGRSEASLVGRWMCEWNERNIGSMHGKGKCTSREKGKNGGMGGGMEMQRWKKKERRAHVSFVGEDDCGAWDRQRKGGPLDGFEPCNSLTLSRVKEVPFTTPSPSTL